MSYPLRDVIPKTKTNVVGKTETFTLRDDINKQSLDDIQQLMKTIAADETEQQIRLGNPPSRIITDNREGKPATQAEKRIEVIFGASLPRLAMVTVEQALLAAIRKSTGVRSGGLVDLGNWEWIYLHDGTETTLNGPQELAQFKHGDIVLLRPKLDYASIVNNVVANQGSVGFKTKGGGLGMGFFGFAAQAAKRNPQLRNFTIYAGRTGGGSNDVTGEESKTGTMFIAIRAARAKRYRKL